MSLRRRDRQQQSEGLGDRQGERYGWQAAITETEAPCERSQMCVWQYARKREAQSEWRSGGEEEKEEEGATEGGLRSLPAWAPADSHTGRSQAHHVSSVCGNPPSSNDKFATRLPLSDLRREAEETSEGKGCVCACVRVGGPVYVCARKCLFLSLLPSRGQLPAPPRATLPSQAFHSAACFSSSSPSSSETSVSEYAMSVSKRIHPRSAQS